VENKKDFFVSKVERDIRPPVSSSEELYNVVLQYNDIVFGFQTGKQKFLVFYVTHNWLKRSIFWEFSYWKTNFISHNIDVIYIEKNMFENIFNTITNVKVKTKDNIKTIIYITLFCHHKNMELVYNGSRVAKPTLP
jgi:hypothetical protein